MSYPHHPASSERVFASVGPARIGVGHRLVARHGRTSTPEEFELLGLAWDLLPQVFAPAHTDSTELFTTWLPFPMGGSFLEVGCGAGVTAVMAARAGCAHVTAVDITPEAVRNTALNAQRHNLADRVVAVQSDLYDALPPSARFDLVFWNSNAIPAPREFVYARPLQHAIFDRDYAAHDRYLREGLARLTDGGRMFLGFNSLGDAPRLHALAAESGVRLVERRRMVRCAGDVPVTFQLLEATPACDRQTA
ncbi:methyltransferase [Streptomyces rubiginosohelvolus]|uniref:methyltransferase n=1 Tax=Streptomyces rubiginosohelvolus TaxID=67362 RepID=UPI0033E9456C